jgi:hypothetical protein
MDELSRGKIDPQCSRKQRRIDDSFFLPGDRLTHTDTVTIAIMFPTDATSDAHTEVHIVADNHDDEPQFLCTLCSTFFSSIAAWESHYEATHVFQCHACHEIFPCNRLLDLHLEERHDSFFVAALEHNRTGYKCLVTACQSQFRNDKERHCHLVQAHDYPKWFRFHSRRNEKNEKKLRWLEKHTQHNVIDEGQIMNLEPDPSKEAKKQKRRKRQKEKRSITPCKFFGMKEGCFRGSKCMFLHSDGVVDDLAQAFSAKATVSVPDKISFGMRRR